MSEKHNVERIVRHWTTVVTRGLQRPVNCIVPLQLFKHDGGTALCYVWIREPYHMQRWSSIVLNVLWIHICYTSYTEHLKDIIWVIKYRQGSQRYGWYNVAV